MDCLIDLLMTRPNRIPLPLHPSNRRTYWTIPSISWLLSIMETHLKEVSHHGGRLVKKGPTCYWIRGLNMVCTNVSSFNNVFDTILFRPLEHGTRVSHLSLLIHRMNLLSDPHIARKRIIWETRISGPRLITRTRQKRGCSLWYVVRKRDSLRSPQIGKPRYLDDDCL